MPLKEMLMSEGVKFSSETDTEVIAQLIDYYYEGDLIQAVSKAMDRLEGSYALGIMSSEHPDMLVAARKESPLMRRFQRYADVLHIQQAEQGDERHVQGSRKRIRSDILLSLASFENRLPARSPRERSPLARHNKDRPFGPLPDNKQIKYMTIWQM